MITNQLDKSCVFTICANNYLAQALALKESLRKNDSEIDFFIFIADQRNEQVEPIDEIIYLDESWIPSWKKMAFKYNVIEFSTSIKPFCINYLFKEYDKVIYLDPDIYVTDSLDYIYDVLDEKDVMISPHYCEILEHYDGAVTEEELLFVGIYNLGFLAIKNSLIGKKIIAWWMNRLADKCYADKYDALHVDQKWFDFIPALFPNNIEITHHLGINTAIWNLHEREFVDDNGSYSIKSRTTGLQFPLLFFHFSGFNPLNPKLINRRHPKYNIESFPSFISIFEIYSKLVLKNNFQKYINIPYAFECYENSEKITPLHRRLFRQVEARFESPNPFAIDSDVYGIFKKNKLLTGAKVQLNANSNPNNKVDRSSEINKAIKILSIFKSLIGIKHYNYILSFFSEYHRLDKQTFLIKNEK